MLRSASAVTVASSFAERRAVARQAPQPTGQPDAPRLQRRQVDGALDRVVPGRPTSCREGSRRAAAGSGTSSIVRARRPVASSHQKTSMPR